VTFIFKFIFLNCILQTSETSLES